MTKHTASAEERLGSLSKDKAALFELLLERKRRTSTRQITPVARGHSGRSVRFPASGAQQRLWFIDQLQGPSGVYNIPVAVRLQGELHREALRRALDSLVARHETLRTVFIAVDGEPMQEIISTATHSLRDVDLRVLPPLERNAQVRRQIAEESADPFNLQKGPLIRSRLLQLADQEHVLLMTMHHIVSDGWSMAVLVRELTALYSAYRAGQSDPLTPLPVQYADYVQWQDQWLKDARLQQGLDYWRTHLEGAPAVLDLPTDRARPATQSYHGASVDLSLGTELTIELRNLSRQSQLTLAMTLYAAWAIVLSRLSGQEDVVTGTLAANRQRTELEGLIGYFVNTLALRMRLDDDPSVSECLQRAKEIMLAAYSHQDVPFERVVDALQPVRSLSHSPVFQVMFVMHNAPNAAMQLPGLSLIEEEVPLPTAKFDLLLSLQERDDGIRVTLNYATDLFDSATIERWAWHFKTVLQEIVRKPDERVSKLRLLTDPERRELIYRFQAVKASPPAFGLIHEGFEKQAERSPNNVAVVYQTQSLTYAELNRRANQLARHLRSLGVGPDSLVALWVERGVEMVVGILAILKAGGAYVPLDPAYPIERLSFMLSDADPKVVLTSGRMTGRLPGGAPHVIRIDDDWEEIARQPSDNLDLQSHRSSQIAYVIYTSGSTGQPKGVMVEHANVMRLFAATQDWFEFNSSDVWTLFHSIAFDFSVWELWGALLHGGRVVVVPYLIARAPADFYRLLCAKGVTVLNQTPSAFAQLIEAQSQSPEQHALRVVIFGGEALEPRALRPWIGRNGAERPRLINMYGITETTVHVTYHPLTQDEIQSGRGSRIGKPIPDLSLCLLDRHGEPVPVGVMGEIYVGGAGVARGYLNRAELTRQRFLPDPFTSDPEAQLYRSGDLGRLHSDGSIEYLGRNDHQVKIRGFRIELGEIEAKLLLHADVADAVVIAREDTPGQRRLVAYVVGARVSGAGSPNAEALRTHLQALLPEHMIPAAFVTMERFPLTANGKLARDQLPRPDESAIALRQYVAPRNDLERTLCEIWAQVLGLPRVGVEDNFFSVGGDSILSLRVLSRARSLGLSFEIADLFRYQSIGQLAAEIESNQHPVAAAVKIAPFELLSDAERSQFAGREQIVDAYPLSLLQEGMHFHSEVTPHSAVYHDIFSYCIEAAFHREHFVHSLQALLDRHPILRTGFVTSSDHRLLQVVHKTVAAKVTVEDISKSEREVQEQLIRDWINQEKHQGFVWSQAPLLRVIVHLRETNRFQYNLSFHHAILDGWSAASLQTELLTHYFSLLRSESVAIAAPQGMFRDYIAREQRALQSPQTREYWRGVLEGASLPTLPRSRDLSGQKKGQDVDTYTVDLEPAIGQGLGLRAQQMGVHVKTLLLAAHVKVMSVICAERTVLTGVVSHGRLEEEDGDRVLGLHLNSLPLRLEVREGSWKELALRVRSVEQEMLPHRHYPLAAMQKLVGCAQLIDTLFNFTRFHVYRQFAEASKISEAGGFEQTSFSLLVNFSQDIQGAGVFLSLSFDPAVLEKHQVERVGGYYERALRQMVQDIDASHHEPTLLGEAERSELLRKFSGPHAQLPSNRLIHELFELQVERTPGLAAVVHEGRSLSYSQLNARANQLAHYLRANGVRPDGLVGACLERGVDLVVGLLGILKAGAAYVPLDPNYPAERLQYMLEDAAPEVVLTHQRLRDALSVAHGCTVALDAQWPEIAAYPDHNLSADDVAGGSGRLVYVIYTSGSTGRPKGTEMSHRSMVNLIEWHRATFPDSVGTRVLQFAALSFDVAFQEVFSTLCTGGILVMLDEWIRKDAAALLELLGKQSIERLFVPPLMLQSLAECFKGAPAAPPMQLRDIVTAGEQLRLSPEIAQFVGSIDGCRLHNHYGPTETHVVTALTLEQDTTRWPVLPTIGRPIANTSIYVLDQQRQLVPVGVVGEIYIGGANVARGYRGQPYLTMQRFLPDPFAAGTQARAYKTGDLGRWRSDGTLEYLGRNDDQVKIRGHRVELGEVEAQLSRHPQVNQAAVVAREDIPGSKRLVAYITCQQPVPEIESLRVHLKTTLPEHMIPSAFVVLDHLPLTPSGKLDRRSLPMPEAEAFATRPYEAPQGEVEQTLAAVWQVLLAVERVGRQDSFFELGGHSLLMVQMIARLRNAGLSVDVRTIYASSTLAELARAIRRETAIDLIVPSNLIPAGTTRIDPSMLPLVKLGVEHIERIVRSVPGGAANIQDVYPLVALQEGILFHHQLNGQAGDVYVRPMLLSLPSREHLDAFIRALQQVIDRHDVLRTAVLWEQLPQPVQVVYRQVMLPVEEVSLDDRGDPVAQLKALMRPDRLRLDVRKAPLVRLHIAAGTTDSRWYALLRTHHLVCDNQSVNLMFKEILDRFAGRPTQWIEAVPYREHVGYAMAHAGIRDAEAFFRAKLGDVDEPTAPFGILDVRGEGSGMLDARELLDPDVALRLRARAKRSNVTPATLFHAAWALVVSRTSNRDDVVYGTVLLGRLNGHTDIQRTLGMFINTLPLRLRLKDISAKALVEQTQRELAELLDQEQAPLAAAQRCSGIAGSAPLFTTLLNYLHGAADLEAEFASEDVEILASQGGSNYPVSLSVNDRGQDFELAIEADRRIDAQRLLGYLQTTTRNLVAALEEAPDTLALSLPMIPADERRQIVESFNATSAPFPRESLIHELFEEQVERTPAATAVVDGEQALTYAALNERANKLAHYLIARGLQAGEYVPILMARSLDMLIAQLAVLKGGAVYVPMDPTLPVERQLFMTRDCGAHRIIAAGAPSSARHSEHIEWVDPSALGDVLERQPSRNVSRAMATVPPAYVMYTSGSTGTPKGVIVPHRAVNRLAINNGYAQIGAGDCIAHHSNPAFDASTFEVWGALLNGATVVIVSQPILLDAASLAGLLKRERVTLLYMSVGLFNQHAEALADAFRQLRYLMVGGDALDAGVIRQVLREGRPRHLLNVYGPTECTTFSTRYVIDRVEEGVTSIPIGQPISNAQIYILDSFRQPVPLGATGEIYIGGAGVADGYLNRPELTAERFLPDPFSNDAHARLYRTGDLGRWRADGAVEFLGRTDFQVKIRGYRIELGEIDARLMECEDVRDAVVIARADGSGEKQLVAYFVSRRQNDESMEAVRTHLKAVLPQYMVPSALVRLQQLPLTPTGKVDRRALPAPDLASYASQQYEPPRGEVEETVAAIWQELLGVARVGRQDNFFELGGHSLQGMKLIGRVAEKLRVRLLATAVFRHPTVRELAVAIEAQRAAGSGYDGLEATEIEEGTI